MKDWREVTATYRSPDRTGYPELDGYTRDEIYEDCLGGGALYLAARMVRSLSLNPGDMETFNAEFSPEERQNPPAAFNYNLPPPHEHINVWEEDFSKTHSPPWWEALFRDSGLLQ
jgi:hypothetical protein